MTTKRGEGVRCWHYAVASRLGPILQDRELKPMVAMVPPSEKPAVWCSTDPVWELTANLERQWPDGTTTRLTRDETAHVGQGLIRIEIAAENVPITWKDHKAEGGVPTADARRLEKAARGWGADPRDWRISYEAIPLEQWVRIETWDGSTWSELKEFRFGDDVFEMAPADHEPDSNPE